MGGEFHGEGALVYPNGGRYQAKWERGYAVEGRYVFKDGLLYEDRNWQYVSPGDRRFYTEVLDGLQPAGKTLLTNERTPPQIPKGTYDTGSGLFDPATEQVLSYDGKEVISYPAEVEMRWYQEYCRKGFEDAKAAASDPNTTTDPNAMTENAKSTDVNAGTPTP